MKQKEKVSGSIVDKPFLGIMGEKYYATILYFLI